MKWPTEFERDESKRAANLAKHGIDFAEVARFDLAGASIVADERRDYGETRFRAFFRVKDQGRALVFTWRAGKIRVTSLRRAHERETNQNER